MAHSSAENAAYADAIAKADMPCSLARRDATPSRSVTRSCAANRTMLRAPKHRCTLATVRSKRRAASTSHRDTTLLTASTCTDCVANRAALINAAKASPW
eukprot:scaffold401_cov399-Prasinococcus_capsulatus_cf.AAC.44